jgi:hypothetical protein
MTFSEFKKAASDFFTPAELVELLDITTEELLSVLEENTGTLDDDTLSDIKEIMGVNDE